MGDGFSAWPVSAGVSISSPREEKELGRVGFLSSDEEVDEDIVRRNPRDQALRLEFDGAANLWDVRQRQSRLADADQPKARNYASLSRVLEQESATENVVAAGH